MAQLAGQPHFRGGQHLTYGTPSQQRSSSLKRVRPHEELDMNLGLEDDGLESLGQQSMVGYGQPPPPQHHHHHHIPDSGRPSKMSRHGGADEGMMSQGAPSVVGQPGMPSPAQKPRGPKLKFTPEDDQLLVDLKENKSLTWKQIAEFFPGRSSGTLQVRYCTKLKAKTTQWTDETVRITPPSQIYKLTWCYFRFRSFASHFRTMSRRSGALLQARWGLDLHRQRAGRRRMSYSSQRLQQERKLLSSGTFKELQIWLRIATAVATATMTVGVAILVTRRTLGIFHLRDT